ncbi:GPN-loop GTPase [Globomyces pollinis-pini]|nr:GPN-loop GTPase [Globomyces pollinis-pini]
MGKTCQLVMGPAGSGKSTYCTTIVTHCQSMKRNVHLVNLDPAAEYFEYEPSIDIRELVSLDDVMEELDFGPNGGLIYCLEYLVDNLDWFEEQIQEYEDDNIIIDCPGQIELYTHCTIMKQLVDCLHRNDYRVCGIYLLDCQFIQDTPKFFAGIMSAMSAMLQLGIPHINVMTKMDLLGDADAERMERFFNVDSGLLLEEANSTTSERFHSLNAALVRLIDEFNMVNLIPLNIKDEDSIAYILSHVDNAIQYGEDLEPKEVVDDDIEEDY